jgi:hypothetical protein
VILVAAGLLVTGCSPDFAPVAVAAVGDEPGVVWNFCEADRGVGSVTVSRVTDAEPEQWLPVWRARLQRGATALDRVPITDAVDGYAVETRDSWPLQPDVRYAVTDATDTAGVNVLAYILDFRVSGLRNGEVVADPETHQGLDTWLGPDGPECR